MDAEFSLTKDFMIRKRLLALTPSGPLDKFDIPNLFEKLPAEMAVPFWLSFVDPEIVVGEREAAARRKMAIMCELLPDDYVLRDSLLPRATNVQMFLSYMDFREKHQPMKYNNRLLRRWAESKGVKAPAVVRLEVLPGEKPSLLGASEHFRSWHAMPRCYRKAIDSLREHFHTIGVCIDRTIEENLP